MTVVVPGVGVISRKPFWKQLLPEVPATRLACLTSGSFRPKLGLGILFLVLVGCICLVIVPLVLTPFAFSSTVANNLRMANSIANKEAVSAVASGNTEFSQKLYSKLATGTSNMVMSPFSVSSVLSMSYAGAKGNTALQMKQGLSLPDSQEVVLQGYKDVLSVLKSNENFTLDTANRMYVHQGYELLAGYLATTKSSFLSEAVSTDFAREEEARAAINGWVEKQTQNKIKELIGSGILNDMTRLVLVNAVYFKGNWATQFDPKRTTKVDFHVTENHVVQADMMHIKEKFGYLHMVKELDGASALEMPYKGDRISMIFLLPKSKGGLEVMEKAMQDFDLDTLMFDRGSKVEVALPKFKVESSHDLVQPLKDLGMTDMFSTGRADFSGISGTNDLYVSKVLQKAFIEVNEEGAEAAAATAQIMMMRMAVMTPSFRCDHPFVFVIKDKLTGMVLFTGRVTDPTKN